jgi:hypothetical protein
LIPQFYSPLHERAAIRSATNVQFYTKYGTWAYSYTAEPPFQIQDKDLYSLNWENVNWGLCQSKKITTVCTETLYSL